MRSDSNAYPEEVVAMIVHELRNPLAVMSNALELCGSSADRQPPSAARQLLARQLDKALRLVDDLLDVSRLGSEARIKDGAPVDLASVLRSEIADLDHRISARQQMLRLEVPANAIWVHGDRMRLGQIVVNLLDNSSKYSPVGGWIGVQLLRDADHVVLRVRDSGIGIRKEELPHIFDPFYRGSSASCREAGGLGLGLALVRRLVELHRGLIEARSDGEDCGSEFTVRLPAL